MNSDSGSDNWMQDDINLADPNFFKHGDPHSIWRRFRMEDPVHLTKSKLSKLFWSITRYDDAKFVLASDGLFSTQESGIFLPADVDCEDPEASPFTKALRNAAMLAVLDGTPHSDLRRYFQRHFSPAGVKSLAHLIRTIAHRTIDGFIERGECDFTTDFAGRVPTALISAIMDIPEDRWADLYRWNNMVSAPADPEYSIGDTVATSTFGVTRIIATCLELVEARRGSDRTDLLTALGHAEINGRPLDQSEIGFNSLMFFGGGHETTRSSMSMGLLELLRNPAQFDLLYRERNNPRALSAATDEFLRFSAPVAHTLRTATQDTAIRGQPIKKGDWVVVWFHGANRDTAVFNDAERFDITRSPNPHLSFATGKHFCLGAHLAKLDMQIMLEVVLERLENIELTGPIEMQSSNLFWGAKHMPIRFKSRAARN